MTKILARFLTILFLSAIPCFAQQTDVTFADNRAYITFKGIENWEFKPIQVGDKFGFDTGEATGAWGITLPSEKVEIHPLFDKVCRFKNGYAPVKLEGSWGIIDTMAEFVVEPAWEKVWSPQNNGEVDRLVMRFSGDGVDPDDLYEVDPLEDWTNGFRPGVFPLWKNERWHLIASSGNLIGSATYESMLPMAFERAAVFADKLWGYVSLDGQLAVPLQFRGSASFREGRAAVRKENLWGYIDISGRFIIPEQFERAGDFASGTAIVIARGNFGIIDQAGNYLVQPEYAYINEMPEPDLFNICSAFETGLFHRTKGMILPVIYDSCSINPDGSILAARDKKQGLFDADGNVLLPPGDAVITSLGNSFLLCVSDTSLSVYDSRQKKLVELDYKTVNKFSEGLAAFQTRERQWGFLDMQLKEKIPPGFIWVSDFSEGQAAVESADGIMIIAKDGQPAAEPKVVKRPIFKHAEGWQLAIFNQRLGVQNAAGIWRVRPEYRDIRAFPSGVLLVQRDKTWTLITAENEPGNRSTFDEVGHVSENRCWVRTGDRYGFLDDTGQMVIPQQYDMARKMKNGMAAVRKNKLWGFIDPQGKELLPNIYTDVQQQDDGTYIVFEGNRKGYVHSNGQFMPAESENLPPELEKKSQ